MKATQSEIYFHVGLGKTGTTFLQYNVFNKLKGVYYIQRTKYKKAIKIIGQGAAEKYFISREFDQQIEVEVMQFAKHYPNTTAIIVFRRHDGWIASQYRRFVKNGYICSFEEFLDLEHDSGIFKIKDLTYYNMILLLEKHFTKKPLVLFYEDLKTQPYKFIEKIAAKLGASFDKDSINLTPRHQSYNTQQLKAVKWLASKINIKKERIYRNDLLHAFHRVYLSMWRYGVLYLAKVLPNNWFSKAPLITNENLLKVKKHFEMDWELCKNYAKK